MSDLPAESFFLRSPLEVAPQLLGCLVVANGVALRIVETEAYLGASDRASHARSGPTARCLSMFGPVGRVYVYRSYGVHLCLNVVCHRPETGGAVLLRAGSVVEGMSLARVRRENSKGLADGPGKLAQCLAIEPGHDGSCLCSGPIKLRRITPLDSSERIVCGPRIGIGADQEKPYRFWIHGNRDVSRGGSGGARL